MTSHDLRWPEVTQKWCHFIGSHLEVAEEGQKLAYTVHYTSCKAVAHRRRQSRDRKWRHLTSGDRKWPWSDVIWPEVTCKWLKAKNSPILYISLPTRRSLPVAVTWQEMMSLDLRWAEGTQKWRHLTGSPLEVAVEVQKLSYIVHFTFYKAVARRSRLSCDRKWRHVASGDLSDPEVTSFYQKSPGSGCRRLKTRVYCTFPFLQGCSSQQKAVTWLEMMSRHLMWPEVTRKWRHLTGSHLEVTVESQNPHIVYISLPTRGSLAGGGSHVTENLVTSPRVTGSYPEETSFDRKSPGSACKRPNLAYSVHLTSYEAAACRKRLSHCRKWRHVVGSDPEVKSFDWKLPGSCCGRPKKPVYCTFHFLNGGRSQGGGTHVTGNDVTWPQGLKVTLKWCHLTGSDLEVVVEGQKLAYTVHFTSYKAVARKRRLSRDRKWRRVTWRD